MATRKIEVAIVGDSRSLQRALGQASKSGNTFGRTFGKVVRGGALLAGGALAGLGVAAKIGFDEFSDAQKVGAQTSAVLKSTGKAANIGQKGVERLAGALMRKSGIDDEAIQSGENLLLTFTRIRNETGKGNDIFKQATTAALDMSVAMGSDMRTASLQVGKALQDPVRGMTALRRVGVSFTKGQEKTIKKLVESGQTLKAQKLILKELNTEFGSSAKNLGQTLPGRIDVAKERFKNFAGGIVNDVIPALEDLGDRIANAKGFKAKLKVVWTGVREAGAQLVDLLSKALLGETKRHAIKMPTGAIEWVTTTQTGLVQAIQDGLRGIDWSGVGRDVGAGISKSVRMSADFIESVLTSASAFIDSHSDQLAELGAKMLLQIVSKLIDPGFWARHWKLVVGIAIAAFPIGRMATLGGKIAAAILGQLGRRLVAGFRELGFRASQALLGVLGKLPGLMQRIMVTAVAGGVRALSRLVSYVRGQVGGVLAKVPVWLKAAFRLSFFTTLVSGIQAGWARIRAATSSAVNFLTGQWARIPGPIQTVISALSRVWGWLTTLTSHPWTVILKIPRPSLPDIPGIPGIAKGTSNFAGGLALVGERGPELVTLPRGAAVKTASETRGLLAGAGAGGRVELVITNWADGTGYIRQLAEGQVVGARARARQSKRMGG